MFYWIFPLSPEFDGGMFPVLHSSVNTEFMYSVPISVKMVFIGPNVSIHFPNIAPDIDFALLSGVGMVN